MKTLAGVMLLVCAALVAQAASIDGKWTSETQVGDADGKTYTQTSTFVFTSAGGSLTGTVVQTSEASWMKEWSGKVIDISDGKLDGETFSFRVKRETAQGERTAIYEGTIKGDELNGTTKFRGIGITQPFHAKRSVTNN